MTRIAYTQSTWDRTQRVVLDCSQRSIDQLRWRAFAVILLANSSVVLYSYVRLPHRSTIANYHSIELGLRSILVEPDKRVRICSSFNQLAELEIDLRGCSNVKRVERRELRGIDQN